MGSAGLCCCTYCGVCLLVIGLPMLICGVLFIQVHQGHYDEALEEALQDYEDDYSNVRSEEEMKELFYKGGIGIIVVSLIILVIGAILVIYVCYQCCNKSQTGGQVLAPSTHTTSVQYTQQYPGQPNTYYPPPAQNIQQPPPPAYNPNMPPNYGEKATF